MSENEFLSSEVYSSPEECVFRVEHPSLVKWIIISSLSIISVIAWFLLIGQVNLLPFFISAVTIPIAVFCWNKVGLWSINKIIIGTVETWKNSHPHTDKTQDPKGTMKIGFLKRLYLLLLGLRYSRENRYYFEQTIPNRNVKEISKIVSNLMVQVTSACLGVGFLIAIIVRPLINSRETALLISVLIIIGAPIFISWLIPLIWTLKDINLKYVNSDQEVRTISDDMRKGILSRFLGFSGFIAGMGFLIDILPEMMGNLNNDAPVVSNLVVYIVSVLVLFFIIILIFGTNLLVSVIYITKFHEKRVNDVRAKLCGFIPYGSTRVEIHPEKPKMICKSNE